jgi:uncharacterized membrane protein
MRVLLDGIGERRAADGFIGAIDRCGAVLAQHIPPGMIEI